MEIRKITKDESKEYHRLSQYAFGNWKDKEVESDTIKWQNPEESFVVIEDGKMVSGLISHSLKQSVRGIEKRLSGIGNVATYPEFRNKGYVKALFGYAYKDMKAKGISVSMLQPFKESFYEKLGYVSTNREINLHFHVSGIQHYLSENFSNWTVERKTGLIAQEEFHSFYAKKALSWHGQVIADEIHQGFKEYLAKDTIYIIVKYNNQIRAVCSYKKKETKIIIKDIFWCDLTARKVLFNYLAKHRDQVGNFEMYIPMDINFYNWFYDSRNMYELKMCEGPWMVRIVDANIAFNDLALSHDSSLIMEISDEMCDWNNGTWQFSVKDGLSEIRRVTNTETIDVKGDIRGFSALLYGSLPLDEIIEKGWLQVKDENVVNILQEMFPTLILFNTFMF